MYWSFIPTSVALLEIGRIILQSSSPVEIGLAGLAMMTTLAAGMIGTVHYENLVQRLESQFQEPDSGL